MRGLMRSLLLSSVLLGVLPVWAQQIADPVDVDWKDTVATYQAEALTVGPSARLVADAQAQEGKAVAAVIGQGRAGHILSGGWVPVRPDQKYEITFHMRFDVKVVSPADTPMPIYVGTEDKAASSRFGWPLRLEAVYKGSEKEAAVSVIHWRFARISDVQQAGQYHDYVITVDTPPPGVVGFRAYWYGRAFASVWIDSVQVRALPAVTETEALKDVPAPAFTIDHAHPKTLVVNGVYQWTYRVPELIGGPCEAVWQFPADAAGLAGYDALVLADVNLGDLKPAQRLLLAGFVKAGGGLLVLGGPYAYGKSAVHVSPLLQELLPVRTAGLWDIRKAQGGSLRLSPSAALLALDWAQDPRVYYYHVATPKPGAQVWLTGQTPNSRTAQTPLLVVGRHGQGQVAAFLITPFGLPQAGETPLWAWREWGDLLNLTLKTITGRQGPIPAPGYVAPEVKTSPRPPAPAARPPAPVEEKLDGVAVLKVWPEKLCVRPGEWAKATVTLGNGTAAEAPVKLVVTLDSGLHETTVLKEMELVLPANTRREIPVTWQTGKEEEWGRTITAELRAADGTSLSRQSEVFTIGWNNYRVGQCRLVQPWTWDQGAKTFPAITPEDRWSIWLPGIRAAYATTTEYFFWAPDDFGNLLPEKDQWFSGQATYLISQEDIRAVIDAAHAQGIAAVTYGKKWFSVSGLQAGRDGVELIREHPEWCEWDVNGHPKWWFDADKYGWTLDQWRDEIENKGKRSIGGAAVNCVPEDCVRYGLDQLIRSAKKYGWDGVRFDDHFTADAVFDGGLAMDGETTEHGQDYEAITVRNNRLTREVTRQVLPHYLVGFNYGGTYTDWGVRQPDAFVETCKDGQFVMIEHSVWWNSRTWPQVINLLAQENHRVQALGGVPGMVSMSANEHLAHRWETAINYASQGHYYNVRNCPEVVQYTKFMLRYGEVLYDPRTRYEENADWVSVTPADQVIYRPFTHRRTLDAAHQQIVVSLLNDPGEGKVDDLKTAPVPVQEAMASITIPPGWMVARAWRLNPDDPAHPCTPIAGAMRNGTLVLTVPSVEVWNVLVVELEKGK